MDIFLKQYRTMLVNRILVASSSDEVKRHIHLAIKTLRNKNIERDTIGKFTNIIFFELNSFNPMYKDSQQWNNINVARIEFYRMNMQFECTAL